MWSTRKRDHGGSVWSMTGIHQGGDGNFRSTRIIADAVGGL